MRALTLIAALCLAAGAAWGQVVVVTYIDPNGNASVVTPGATITIPPVNVGSTLSLSFDIADRDVQPAMVNSVGISGAGFQLSGAPLPGSTLAPGADVHFTVIFKPQIGAASGTLSINVGGFNGSISLAGTGLGAQYTYQVQSGATTAKVAPGQTITIPDTAMGGQGTAALSIQNSGNAAGTVNALMVAGNGFSITNAPFLPLSIPAGATQALTISFAPTQPGPAAGRLQVGTDSFALASNGLGPALSFTYSAGGTDISLPNSGGTISFSPIAVGATESITVKLVNTGTAQAVISNIGAVSPGGVFTVAHLPALPLTLNAGASSSFNLVFSPNNTGALTGSLMVDGLTFSVVGSGTAPAALSSVAFSGASGVQQPLTQPAIGLSLQSPYPIDVNGTLTLTFNSAEFSDDPSIQFSTGGRTVAFVIPAGSTAAVFPGSAQQIRLQTGSVAGNINLTPSFATTGGVALQAPSGTALILTVPQSAPQMTNVVVDSISPTGFDLAITGLATTRQMNQIVVQFTPVAGLNLSIPNATLNVSGSFNTWYQTTTSQSYGSLFTVNVPFTLQGQVSGYANLIDALQSVTVTISNAQGSSSAQTVSLH